MKNILIIISSLILIISLGSCRKDFDTTASFGNLSFSKETVFLDTIFANIGSSTYNLKVYNTSGDDIHIPTISLENGATSKYRLMVDGIAGQSFENIQIKAKDSIYIFIETTVSDSDNTTTADEFLYEDNIVFDANTVPQKVALVTLVKDAELIFPSALNEGELNDYEHLITQENWTNNKPYVIYGFLKVPDGQTLNIEPGARIHFHRDAGLIIESGATIVADGNVSTDPDLLENEIIFEGDRLEPLYSDIPGQWGTIWLQEGSTNNLFDYVTIKNGTIGIRSDGNDGDLTTTITNTQLYNHAVNGIFAFNGEIEGKNIVVGNCGQASVSLALGGTYNFQHCTFTNYWSSSFRSFPTLLMSNSLAVGDTLFVSQLDATFTNCIVYGNDDLEFSFFKETGADLNFKFTNCLLRFNDTSNQFGNNLLYDFNDIALYEGCIFNETPLFLDRNNNQFQIEEGTSPADNTGFEITPSFNDLLNTTRTTGNYDIGAYQATIF
jgi:uncharacterized protein YxeA